jgi:hypothetical protein
LGLNAFIGAQRAKLDLELASQLIEVGKNAAVLTSDVNALILFALGVLFFALAAWKGYGMLGTIPGYKSVAEDYDRAHQTVQELEEGVRTALRDPVQREMSELQALARKITEAGERISLISADLKQSKNDFEILASGVEGALKVICETYRQNNAAARPGNIPVPAYFSEPIELKAEPNPQLSELMGQVVVLKDKAELLTASKLPQLHQHSTAMKLLLARSLGDSLSAFFLGLQEEARAQYIASIPVVKEV